MSGEPAFLQRFIGFRFCLALMLGLGCTGLLGPVALAQDSAPAPAPTPGTAAEVNRNLEDVLGRLSQLTPAQIQEELEPLLSGNLDGVLTSAQTRGLAALAGAYERLAQDKLGDGSDPAAKRNADGLIDQAVVVLLRLGDTYRKDKQPNHPAAIQTYNRVLSHRPDLPAALQGLARTYSDQGRPLIALENYESYIKAAKKDRVAIDPTIYAETGKVYASANLWNQAMKSYREAEKAYTDADKKGAPGAELYGLMAEALLQVGARSPNKTDEAFGYADKAVQAEPGNPLHYARYAGLLLEAAKPDDRRKALALSQAGIEVARQRLQAEPDNQEVLDALSRCYAIYTRIASTLLEAEPQNEEYRLAIVKAIRAQSEIATRRASLQAISILDQGMAGGTASVALLQEMILLQKVVQSKDLEATCHKLLKLDENNALAKETLAALKQ